MEWNGIGWVAGWLGDSCAVIEFTLFALSIILLICILPLICTYHYYFTRPYHYHYLYSTVTGRARASS